MDGQPRRSAAVPPASPPPHSGSAAVADAGRLTAVRATELLDAVAGSSFDRLTALARRLTGAPLAFITVVDDQRSYWLSRQGLPADGPVQNTVDESFCQYVLGGEPLVLADVTADDRTRGNPSIEGMGVRAWAGFPVYTPDGQVLGSFCVVDTDVHEWTESDVALLEDLAAIASREVTLRAATTAAEDSRAAARAEADRASLLARIGGLLATGSELADVWEAIATLAVPALGDFAYVCTVERDGSLRPVAARHRDADGLATLWDWISTAGRRAGEASGPGHVAATGKAERIVLPSPDRLTPAQRAAAERLSVQSAMVVPLTSRQEVVAVLTVARLIGSPVYGDTDQELVTAVADRAALVVENALAYARERTVSETMQRALLPPALPRSDRLEIASRYLPAGDAQLVGGDWYDAFVDATGATSVVIGDVAGHDIDAAATMGELRTMVRMAGHAGSVSAAAVLAAVDAAVATLGHHVFATALVTQVAARPDTRGNHCVQWSSAGHPPPLLVHPDGRVDVLSRPIGLPLGVLAGRPRPDHRTSLPPGATLVLYTDGLIEQTSDELGTRDLDEGLARLVEVVARSSRAGVEALCDQLLALLPPAGADDDVAVIALRVRD
ncbi:SpoIIE family protein phosphatase [Blastococcus goldschmidtiae]|uniref:SpoIIE family protein phosphatase n=1 Tax=Blastococcus goldschmidtiae TaxID=3075546 RepID=A0ABU2K4U8_9ACTN|nr:SpoIIE family protein phosphatase [Blastococcus sp. DSM 46792]MDT0275224.1 SpoIIE family protein phosphatase [Blastococcus sp. DSM 46792]